MRNLYSSIKGKCIIVFCFVLASFFANAQSITNYAFTASSGTFTPISTTAVPLSGGDIDDGYFNDLPIGFTFTYMGVPYTTFSASTNGWLTFGQTLTTPTATNSPSAGTPRPMLAPFWDDLDLASGSFMYETSGTAGNRVLTVQWLNVEWNWQATAPVISFQTKLHEATGAIQFIYQPEAGTVNTGSASIAITATGTGAGNYLSLNNSGATPTASSTTATTNIAAKPASGQTYTFTPPSAIPDAAPTSFSASPVGLTSMTINWVDNSTNETNFLVYRSTDNVTFTLIGSVPSTTSATTGANYSQNQTSLATSTTYYYRIIAMNEAHSSPELTGSATTLSPTFCANRTVGPTGDYPSLTAAFADINATGLACSSILELQAAYNSSVETFPLTLNSLGNTSSVTLTVRPEAGATNLLISGAAAQTFNFNGTNAVIIDGRPGGVGSVSELRIENTSATGTAFTFINGASYNTLQYLTISGVTTTTTSGVIFFSTSNTGKGNSFNTVQNNNIGDGATTPTHLIYSAGTAGVLNTNNTVLNNNLYNFFNAGSTSSAVSVLANNSDWEVSQNKVYQTTPRTYTTGAITHYGIRINSTTGNNFTINNNIIGYANNSGTGIFTMSGAVTVRFSAIDLDAGSVTPSNIQGNLITNISLSSTGTTTTTSGVLAGITVGAGAVNIGNTISNTIGSLSANDVITLTSTSTTSQSLLIGIYVTSSSTVNISNNNIGGLTAASATAGVANAVKGIMSDGTGSYTISGNNIGSTTLAHSLRAGSSGITTGSTSATGIEQSGSGTNTVVSNTIMNLSAFGSGTSGTVRGIINSTGATNINSNLIMKLTSASGSTNATTTASVIGISQVGTAAASAQMISGNSIAFLSSIHPSAAITMHGIYFSGSITVGNNVISRNYIRALDAASTGLATINGININAGATVIRNNMVALGLDAGGASLTSGALAINGIRIASTSTNDVYYNSVNISGTNVTTGTAATSAFIRTAVGINDVKNNIFSNVRSNSTGSGKHYAINLNATTTFTSGNNNYYYPGVSGLMGAVGAVDYPTLANWKIGTGLDASSISVDPTFISATDLHINNGSPTSLESGGVAIAGITNDFDGDVRPGPAGSINGGGTKPDIGADEFDGIPISLDMGAVALVNPTATGCYTTTETVRVRIRNYGGAEIDFSMNPVDIKTEVSGVNPATFPVLNISSGTLAAGATLDTAIVTNYNMSAAGLYTFKAYTELPGDGNNANDTIAVTINVTGGTASASSSTICNGKPVTLSVTGHNGTIQWQSSTDGGTNWANVAGANSTLANYTESPSVNTKYRALICGVHPSTTVDVNVTTVPAPVTVDSTRCGPGPVNLSASGTGTLLWYPSASANNVINTGTTFNPTVSSTTTYYVSSVDGAVQEKVGRTTAGASSFITATAGWGLMFTVTSPASIDTVHVYPTGTGTITIKILDPSNNAVLYTGPVTSIAGPGKVAVPVGIMLPPGNYKMGMSYTGITNLVRESSGNTFPYVSPSGAVSITSGSSGTSTSTSYYWFYDWRITSGCESARTPVTATVTTPPAMSVSATSTTFCLGDSTSITMNSANAYTYTWSPSATLSSSTGTSVIAKPTVSTEYIITAQDALGCINKDSITINVTPLPVVTVSSSKTAICAGDSVNLKAKSFHIDATIFTENFNVAPTNWTITNTSTPSGLQWQFVSNYDGVTTNTLNGTNFAFVDSDTPGSSSVVNSTMTSPVINAAGYDSLVLNFDQYYRHLASTIATVEVFNGTTWVEIYKPTATIGNWNTPNTRSINITPHANANMQIRFNYFGNFDYYWAIDNVSVLSYSENNFSWTGAGLSATNISNPVATPPVTTTYYVTTTDPLTGCSKLDSIKVIVNENPVIASTAQTNVTCHGLANGSASVTVTNGTPAYTFSWSPVAGTNDTLTGLAPGVYSITVTDTKGCKDTASVTITEPDTLIATTMVTNVSCFNGTNGTAMVMPTGGTGSYTYSWDTTPVQTTETAINLGAGTYNVQVLDANGCAFTTSVTITQPTAISLSTTVTNVSCNAGNNGTATVMATGGTGTNYTYSWDTTPSSSNDTLSGLTAGVYTVVVFDENGCSDTTSVTVTEPLALTLALTATDETCLSSCNGAATATVSGGTGIYTYSWNNTGTTGTISNLCAGDYILTVTDENNCMISDTTTVDPGVAAPVASFTFVATNLSVDFTNTSTGATAYNWNFGDGSPVDNTVNPTHAYAGIGNYNVMLIATNSCTSDTVQQTVPVITTGIASASGNTGIEVFPNPTKGIFNINYVDQSSSSIQVKIMNVNGQVIINENVQVNGNQFKKSFDLSTYSKGIYTVQIVTEKAVRTERIVLN